MGKMIRLHQKINIEVAGKVIDLIRSQLDEKFNSPYDIEHWATEYLTDHSNLFKTKRFVNENDYED
jgi:hypothetical protein